MSGIARWWPVAAAAAVTTALTMLSTVTRDAVPTMAALPSPIRVRYATQPQETTELPRPIFGHPAQPVGTDAPAQSAPQLPVLVGIASGRGATVALLKTSDGQTVRARAGDSVDGWTIRGVSGRKIVIGNAQGEQELTLSDPAK